MSIRLAWRPNRQEKNPWQLAAKYIDFPWHSILGGLCLAAGHQEHLPWRFSYIPWRILTAKVNLVSGSVPAVVLAAKRPGHEFSRKKNSTPVRLTMGRDKPSDFNVNHYCKIYHIYTSYRCSI